MGTLLRILLIVGIAVLAYGVFMEARQPSAPGLRGVWSRIRHLGRRIRLVALIYIAVIVASALLRVTGVLE